MPFRKRKHGRGHAYYDENGDKLDSVTKLIGDGLPKPGLVNYAARVTADYAIDHWGELTRDPVSQKHKKMTGARFADRDQAAGRGTQVHALAEQLIHGHEVEVPDELAGHVESYVRFLDTWQPTPILVETPVASRRWRYGGTPDAVIRMPDGRVFIVDLKTNRSGIFPETALQLAAYRYADVYLDDNGDEQPMSELGIVGALGVWVRSDGFDVYELTADESQHRQFLHVATTARWTRDSKSLVGESLTVPGVAA